MSRTEGRRKRRAGELDCAGVIEVCRIKREEAVYAEVGRSSQRNLKKDVNIQRVIRHIDRGMKSFQRNHCSVNLYSSEIK
jgi:hypothetical protein